MNCSQVKSKQCGIVFRSPTRQNSNSKNEFFDGSSVSCGDIPKEYTDSGCRPLSEERLVGKVMGAYFPAAQKSA